MKKILLHPDAEVELRHSVDYYESLRAGLGLDLEEE
jgi:hypothetical protein